MTSGLANNFGFPIVLINSTLIDYCHVYFNRQSTKPRNKQNWKYLSHFSSTTSHKYTTTNKTRYCPWSKSKLDYCCRRSSFDRSILLNCYQSLQRNVLITNLLATKSSCSLLKAFIFPTTYHSLISSKTCLIWNAALTKTSSKRLLLELDLWIRPM